MTVTGGNKVEMFHEGGAPQKAEANERKIIKILMGYEQACPDHVIASIVVGTIVAQMPTT